MFNVILYQPEIPPNTGNVIRLCANSGCRLHLIRPLGFDIDDKHLRRAGLDYHEYATMQVHESLEECLKSLPGRAVQSDNARTTRPPLPNPPPKGAGPNVSLRELVNSRRVFAFTTKASHCYHEAAFKTGDAFLFGPESRGLPEDVLDGFIPEQRLRLPMLPDNRSLNLSNTVAVAVFEAWRQCGFEGARI